MSATYGVQKIEEASSAKLRDQVKEDAHKRVYEQ
jgi:hypothetical protein